MARTPTLRGIHSKCLSEFSRVGSRVGSIRLCFFWCWTFQLKNAFNHFKKQPSLFRTDSTNKKAWNASQRLTYLWDFMPTGYPQHSCSASDALVFKRKGVSPPSYPKSAPKIQKKRYEHENTWQLIKINTLLNYLNPEGFCEIFKDKLKREYFRTAKKKIFIFGALLFTIVPRSIVPLNNVVPRSAFFCVAEAQL